jgi:hypothetical protein
MWRSKDLRTTRVVTLVSVLIAVLLVGCSSSGSTAKPASSTSSTTSGSLPQLSTTAPGDPDEVPNRIPFNVGEIAARPNGWRMGVTRVVRPLTAAGLPALAAGQQYVGVDITLIYDGTTPVTVNTRRVFGVNDITGTGHTAISGSQGSTGLDGTYTAGTERSGRMVFAVPVGKQLLMLVDGPAIHTQRTVFQVDPPTHPAED